MWAAFFKCSKMKYNFDEIKAMLAKGLSTFPHIKAKEKWSEVSRDIKVHYNGEKPVEFFKETFPSEEDEILEYRKKVYKPVTKSVIKRALKKRYRLLAQSNYSIQHENETFEKYLKEWRHKGNDFETFIFKSVLNRRVIDPNGLLVWVPHPPESGSGPPMIKPHLVPCERILIDPTCTDGLLMWYAGIEKKMEYKGTIYRQAKVYWIITKDHFYRYLELFGKSKVKKELEEWHSNPLDEIPAIRLGGVENTESENDEELNYFDSDFSHALPWLYEAVLAQTLHQANMVLYAFPEKVMSAFNCASCDGKRTEWSEKEACEVPCKRCKGSGLELPVSQFKGVVLVPPGNYATGDYTDKNYVHRFVHADVEILKYAGEQRLSALEMAEKSLDLFWVLEAQSGIAKTIDQEEKYSTLYDISNYFFDVIIQRSLSFISQLAFKGRLAPFSIQKPISFAIKSEAQLWEEVCAKIEKNAPIGDIIATYMDYIKKRFSSDRVLQKIEKMCVYYEPLYIYTIEQRQQLLVSGIATKEELIKAERVNMVIREIANEEDQFLMKSFSELKPKIDKNIALFLPNNGGETVSDGQTVTGRFIGVTKALAEIQRNVAQGISSREAAIALIMELLGFDEQRAAALLGNPQAPE